MPASVSPNVGGWVNYFLVKVWITDSVFETKSSSLVVVDVDPLSICNSLFWAFLVSAWSLDFAEAFSCTKSYNELQANLGLLVIEVIQCVVASLMLSLAPSSTGKISSMQTKYHAWEKTL